MQGVSSSHVHSVSELVLDLFPVSGASDLWNCWAGWMRSRFPRRRASSRAGGTPGIFWVHNDSGNPPLLFAIRGDGRIVRQFRLAVPNLDWEDIAIDDQGHLYLGDIGNNTGRLPLRVIYRIDEPDPSSPAEKPISGLGSDLLCFAARRIGSTPRACSMTDGGAYLLAKYLDGREAELFTVPLEPPSPLAAAGQTPVDRAVARIHRAGNGRRFERGRNAAGGLFDHGHAGLPPRRAAIAAMAARRRGSVPPLHRSRESPGTDVHSSWSPRGAESIALPRRRGGRRAFVRLRRLRRRERPQGRDRDPRNVRDHRRSGHGVPTMTTTLPAAASPSATLRPPSLQTSAPASGRFSSSSPAEFNSRPHSLR